MAYYYLFFQPKHLPLSPEQLSEDTVARLVDLAAAQPVLKTALPQVRWLPGGWGRGETADGKWMEFLFAENGTLSLRCSLRADYKSEVQRICDQTGWIAVDERSTVYQPSSPSAPT